MPPVCIPLAKYNKTKTDVNWYTVNTQTAQRGLAETGLSKLLGNHLMSS